MPTHTRRSTLIWVFQIEHTVADILFHIEDVIGQAIQEEPIEGQDLASSAEYLFQVTKTYMEEAELTHLSLRYHSDVAGKVDFSMLSRTIIPHLTVQSEPPVDDLKYVLSVLTSLGAQVIASARDDDAATVHRTFVQDVSSRS